MNLLFGGIPDIYLGIWESRSIETPPYFPLRILTLGVSPSTPKFLSS